MIWLSSTRHLDVAGNSAHGANAVSGNRARMLAIVGLAAVLSSACQGVPPAGPEELKRVPVPPAPLELLEAQPLVLADDCVASGSFRVEFEVLTDGRTGAIKPPPAPECVQRALTAWVGSFRYAPLASAGTAPSSSAAGVPTAIEWMLVTARKGS